jgi:hypothetical protein
MKNRNLILRYFGLLVLITGVVFNIQMFVNEAWPTSLFFIICLIGIIQICFSYYKKIKIGWQIFWSFIPFILGYAYLQIDAPSKDIYLIPYNYRGKVEILYGNADGQEKESEGFWRIYTIPESGKLKTKYKLKGNSINLYNCKYYSVDRNGTRKLLKVYDENSKEKDSVSVQIINWGNLGINGKSQNFYVDIPNNSFFNRKNKNGI